MFRILHFFTFFLISFFANAQPIVPKGGLIVSLPFSGNANDESGKNNHGQLGNSPTLTEDRFGNQNSAYLFGGYNDQDWIRVPNHPSMALTNAMSISLWFKQCSFAGMDGYGRLAPNGYHIIWSKAGDGISANPGLWSGTITNPQKQMTFNFNNTNGYPAGSTLNFTGDTTLPCFEPCDWAHLVMVAAGTSWKVYVNGKLRKQMTIKQVDFTRANTLDLMIGRMNGGGLIWYPFNGVIDDVNFYNRELGQPQVDSLFGNYRAPNASKYDIKAPVITTQPMGCDKMGSIQMKPTSSGGPFQFSFDGGVSWGTADKKDGLMAGTYKLAMRTTCAQWDSTVIVKDETICCKPAVFFVSAAAGQTVSTIWQMDTLGQVRNRLFNDGYHRQSLHINKLGSLLAYTRRKNPNSTGGGDSLWICTSNTDGSNEQPIYLLPEFANQEIRFLRFNNAGTKLLFHKYHDGWPAQIRDGDLFVMDLGTRVVTQLTKTPNFAKYAAEWSPDDKQISFTFLQSGWTAFPIPGRIMDANGANITVFDPMQGGNYGNTLGAGFLWKQGGDGFVFSHHPSLGATGTLYSSNRNGTNVQSLNFTSRNGFDYSFTPDGERLAIGDNNRLVIQTLTGVQQRTIAAGVNSSFRDVNFAWVKDAPKRAVITESICEGKSFMGKTTTGIYHDTLQAVNGCDSIRTLNLIVLPRKTVNISESICEGQSFLGRTASGTYPDTLKAASGCDSIRILNLTVLPRKTFSISESICEGQSFLGRSASGIYRDTLKASNGCDSVRILNLTVLPRKTFSISESICEGQSFLGRMASGTYRDTLKTSTGCDSIRIVNLTVLPRKTFSISEIICEGQSFLGRSASGTYRDTLKAANGCDSVRILNLTVLPSKTFSISESICEGQSFLGRSASGTYRDTLKAGNGCDSIRILNLTVLPRKTFSISESICEGQSFLGRTTTGTYRDTLKAANGCDSIRILNLTVLPSKKFSITQTICEGQSFLGRTLSGTYRDTLKAADGCDSIRILNLTVTTIPRPNLGPDRSFCEGDSIQISPGIFPDYSWQNGATTANIWVRNSGLYWVRVSNGACIATDTLSIGALFPTPHNFLADTFRLCLGEPIEVPGYVRYRWSSGESAATYKVKQFGPLSLEVTTAEGCIGTDQTIIVSNNCKLVFIPNAFSPNGDGLNEVFRPKFGVPVTAYQCLIFNRWGQQIQLSTDPLKGWDGRWNGKYAPIGVYYYIIRFTDGAGERHERNGSVTLVR
jgi:gliding motility-associated-like protein